MKLIIKISRRQFARDENRLFLALDNSVAGSTASAITQAAGTIAAADTHFASISALGKSISIKAGQIPTIKAAFGTATAVRASNIGNTRCASSTKNLSIAPPDVSITIE